MTASELDIPEFADHVRKFYPDDTKTLQSIRFPTGCFNGSTIEDVLEKEGKELTTAERKIISILVNTIHPELSQSSPVADVSKGINLS